jgi:insulysin
MISINKPTFDTRDFVGGTLNNGIKYALITDESLEKSFVSVSVNVGSFSNPRDFQGLAHFLEHMLFMGSEKFPDENHYSKKLNELGGSSNAYTDTTETVYYLNVFDTGLEEMIDIFSRFFIDPIFHSDSIDRELNAVNSEHQKNINNDAWKHFQLSLDLANKNSPINTFMTGSLNTLKKPNIREKVIEFYNKYYKSENISICIASSKSHDELFNIINKTFGKIEHKKKTKLIIDTPFYSENKGKTIHMKTSTNKYELSYYYDIPEQSSYLYSKEFRIFDIILTSKSEKSLYFHLKNLGYLISISTEIKHEGVFIISLRLTKDGYKHMDYCEQLLFNSIEQIINMNIEKYASYCAKILNINFDCLNKIDTENLCNLISVNHFYYDTKNVFDGVFKISKININEHYKKLFKDYINTDNLMKIISTHDKIKNKIYIKSREYETEYAIINDKIDKIDKIYKIYDDYDDNNDYLDVKPHLVNSLDKYEIPILIGEKQWYGGCSKFCEPLVDIYLQLNNSNYYNSPKNYVLTMLTCSIFNFLINTIMYKPFELGYNISFEPSVLLSNININISALNDVIKLNKLLKHLGSFLHNSDDHFLKINKNYTTNLITTFKESQLNINYKNPSDYSSYLVNTCVIQTNYTIDEIVSAVKEIEYKHIRDHIKELLNNTSLTTLVYGNIEINNIKCLFSDFNKLFYNNSHAMPLIKSVENITIQHPNNNEKSHSITYFFKIGKFIPKDFAMLLLLQKILGQLFFDILRTKHQLGYLVRLGLSIFREDYYITEKIQSSNPIDEVKEKINDFNNNIKNYINDCKFDKFKETIKSELNEPEYCLNDKINKYRPEISNRTYLFNRTELIIDQLEKITIHDIYKFATLVFDKQNTTIIIINGN